MLMLDIKSRIRLGIRVSPRNILIRARGIFDSCYIPGSLDLAILQLIMKRLMLFLNTERIAPLNIKTTSSNIK